jgi:hypothetical protein
LVYLVYTSISRLYFHSLSKFPGPRLWAITRIPDAYYRATGHQAYLVADLHRQYGQIVRIAPDELSFNVEEAWNDIYGKPATHNTQLQKSSSQFFKPPSAVNNMLQEPSDEEHQRMRLDSLLKRLTRLLTAVRRVFSPSFSEKSLRDQEPIMNQYFDLLIQQLHENCEKAIDINLWYNLVAFDIIGDLTFGESFGCLKDCMLHVKFSALSSIHI